MERKNKEKSKTCIISTNLNITPAIQKKVENDNTKSHLKSHKFGQLTELNFNEKIKILFDSKKFSIGNQFDQKGSEKFLNEKDECLKLIYLDETILERENSIKKKRRATKSKTEKRDPNFKLKGIHRIKNIKEKYESFFSTESSKQIISEFCSKQNEK